MGTEQNWKEIIMVVVDGKHVSDNIANRTLISGWLHDDQGEVFSAEWFKSVIAEPGLKERVAWVSVVSPEQQRSIDASSREEFLKVVCRNELSSCEANFSLWLAQRHSLVGLAPCSPDELAQYQRDRIEQHNDTLQKLDHDQLRAQVRAEGTSSREAKAQADADAALEETCRREAYMNFPPLPEHVTSEQIKKSTSEQVRYFIRRWGSAQVTSRLRNLS